jgi:hypothetical protein
MIVDNVAVICRDWYPARVGDDNRLSARVAARFQTSTIVSNPPFMTQEWSLEAIRASVAKPIRVTAFDDAQWGLGSFRIRSKRGTLVSVRQAVVGRHH